MEDLSYSTKRLNFLYDFSAIVLKSKKKFCIETLGFNMEERRNNVLFLYKFILKDVLNIKDINKAKAIEKKLGLDFYGKRYVFLYTKDMFEKNEITEETVFFPEVNNFTLTVIYNDWDIDRNLLEEYQWLQDNLSVHNTVAKRKKIEENLSAFKSILKKVGENNIF